MKRLLTFALLILVCALTQSVGCGAPNKSATPASSANKVSPANEDAKAPEAAPPGLQAMAEKLFGSKVRVLLTGDLAHNGHYQVVLLDPRRPVAGDPASGVTLWRAAVLQQEDTGWTEVLRCDEYLKNSSGYLRGTPLAPVTGWQLQVSPDDEKRGHEFSFTPLQVQGIVPIPAIKVRWNRAVNRYQSVNATNQTFLTELPLLETPSSELR